MGPAQIEQLYSKKRYGTKVSPNVLTIKIDIILLAKCEKIKREELLREKIGTLEKKLVGANMYPNKYMKQEKKLLKTAYMILKELDNTDNLYDILRYPSWLSSTVT